MAELIQKSNEIEQTNIKLIWINFLDTKCYKEHFKRTGTWRDEYSFLEKHIYFFATAIVVLNNSGTVEHFNECRMTYLHSKHIHSTDFRCLAHSEPSI